MLPGTSILDVPDKLAGASYLSDSLIQPKNAGKFWEESLRAENHLSLGNKKGFAQVSLSRTWHLSKFETEIDT